MKVSRYKRTKCMISVFVAACLFALTSCQGAAPVQATPEAPVSEESVEETDPGVYIPEAGLSAKETIEAYFEQQYLAYASLSYIDISSLLDMEQRANRNFLVWLQMLSTRRKLLQENDLCYVELDQFPYTITYIDESGLEDDRVKFWNRELGMEDEMIHFVITGEPGKAYPPMLALNSQQTIRLRQVDGMWKITFHYYPGSVRRFRRQGELTLLSQDKILADIEKEFSVPTGADDEFAIPQAANAYSGDQAAQYARMFTEDPNPSFYHIGDWMGNCANFISQCVWYGFGGGDGTQRMDFENMTSDWYAGEGGGTPAWENVDYFWNYATGDREMGGRILQSITEMEPGDLLQIRTGTIRDEGEEDYNHSLVLVDKDTMLMAQNSPGCFVYYSDLINVESRIYRPVYLLA